MLFSTLSEAMLPTKVPPTDAAKFAHPVSITQIIIMYLATFSSQF